MIHIKVYISVVSGLIQTKLLLRNLEFESELYLYDTH